MRVSARVCAATPLRVHMNVSSPRLDSRPRFCSSTSPYRLTHYTATMENFQKLGAFGKNISYVCPAPAALPRLQAQIARLRMC
jgi:hypothetical protein